MPNSFAAAQSTHSPVRFVLERSCSVRFQQTALAYLAEDGDAIPFWRWPGSPSPSSTSGLSASVCARSPR